MYLTMWQYLVVLVIALFSTTCCVQQQWDEQYYPSAEVVENLGLDVTDRAEYDTTSLTAEEEQSQSIYNRSEEAKDEESNSTTVAIDEFADLDQENSETETLTPAVYAPQAKMYIKDDALLLHKPNIDKQAEQEVEPRILNRFSLKHFTSINPSHQAFDREDHNSVYHNHDHQSSSNKPLLEDEPVTETVEEVTTVVTTTTTLKQQKRIAADAKSLGYLIKDLYLRTPLAALVDTHPASLKQSRALWENAVSANSTLSIVLVPFNSTGVGEIAYARGGRGFRAALRSVKPSIPGPSYGMNFDESAGGAVFYGILRAAQLVPYDSAIFLCTDRSPADPDLAQLAATTLIRKRIRLYALWFGSTIEPSTVEEQLYETDGRGSTETLLAEAALRSGGEWIIVRGEPAASAQVSSEELLPADQPEEHIVRMRYDRNNIAS